MINLSNLFTKIEIKDTRFYDKREYFTFPMGTFHLYVVNIITPGFGGLLLSHLILFVVNVITPGFGRLLLSHLIVILFCDITVFVL